MKTLFTLIFVVIIAGIGQNSFAGYNLQASLPGGGTSTINKPVAVNITVTSSLTNNTTYISNVVLTATSTSSPSSARLPMAVSSWNTLNTSETLNAGAEATTTIGAGPLIFFSPSSGITGTGTGTYTIGGSVTTSDGTVTAISIGAVLKVNPVPLPAYERQ